MKPLVIPGRRIGPGLQFPRALLAQFSLDPIRMGNVLQCVATPRWIAVAKVERSAVASLVGVAIFGVERDRHHCLLRIGRR